MALSCFRVRVLVSAFALVAGLTGPVRPAAAETLPPIRSTVRNAVPPCVTPERLMAFLSERNTRLHPKFAGIAQAYRDLGLAWQVRWDYAFFQMALETNYLQFKRGDGSSGDVSLAQNNFAGVGATGGGVPGDRFPDVRTGVLAHIQHLVVYSGELVERPVAERTRLYQGDIIEISRKLGRPVTYGDLSHRWAVDRSYGRNIEVVADLYRKSYCGATTAQLAPGRPAAGLQRALPPPSRLGAPLPASVALSPPTPVEVPHKPKSLVKTIWRRGDSEASAQPPVPPRPVEVHRPQAGGTSATALPAETDGNHAAKPLPPLRETLTGDAAGGVAGFAHVAEAAAGARLPAGSQRPCRIAAGEGDEGRMLLVRSQVGGEDYFTPVNAGPGASSQTVAGMLSERMPGAEIVGVYDGYERALIAARQLCPGG